MTEDITVPDRDLLKGHPLLQARWPVLRLHLVELGFALRIEEVARSNARQGWLYAQGRTPAMCRARGINPTWSRSGPKVTNAWSSRLSPHGWEVNGIPMAAALDVVPLGPDGKPWTADDPWGAFVAAMADLGPRAGLVQFHARGKEVWDQPHLQLLEWSDVTHRLEA